MLELEGEIIHNESTIRALREIICNTREILVGARARLPNVKKAEHCQTLYRAVISAIVVLDKESDIA